MSGGNRLLAGMQGFNANQQEAFCSMGLPV